MKKKLLVLLILSVLCAYALLKFQRPDFLQKTVPTQTDRGKFINFSNQIYLLIGIGLFTVLVFSPNENRDEAKQVSARVWGMGIFSILGITTVSVLILNPLGAFTWNIDRIAQIDGRVLKPYQYNQLNSTSDIIFLGTSISYRIPAERYAQKFSLNGFNLATLGGTDVDYSTLTNFVVAKSASGKKPAVLITEILSPSLSPSHAGVKYYLRYPIEYAVYMPPKFAFETISTHLDNIFTLSAFSQMVYVEYLILNKHWNKISDLKLYSIRVRRIKDEAVYKKRVTGTLTNLSQLFLCAKQDAEGKDLILKMVALSKEQHISIVFYRSPINNDFYAFSKRKPDISNIYKACEKKLNQFMEKIQRENPNVFYVDLSHYEPISSGGKGLYLDTHHLNYMGTNLVLQMLTPTVQKALQYARSR